MCAVCEGNFSQLRLQHSVEKKNKAHWSVIDKGCTMTLLLGVNLIRNTGWVGALCGVLQASSIVQVNNELHSLDLQGLHNNCLTNTKALCHTFFFALYLTEVQ